MAEGRTPIKVGTGYIEIVPKVQQKAKKDVREELQKLGVQSAQGMSKAISAGLAGLPKEARKQAEKAKKEVEKKSLDTKKTLAKIEKQLTREYGEETAKRFKDFRKRELEKQKLTKKSSDQTKKAINDAVRVEEQANKKRLTSAERLERERRKLTEKARKDHEKAERDKLNASNRAGAERSKAEARRRKEEQTEAQKQAKALLKYNKMMHDAYAENERRTRKERQQTATDELKWNKMLAQAYAENERRKRKEAAQTAREEQQWRRTVAQAYAENERRNQAAVRETQRIQREAIRQQLAEQRTATAERIRLLREEAAVHRSSIQDGLTRQRDILRGLRNDMTNARRDITSTTTTTQNFFKRTEGSLRKMGTWFDQVGTSINEAGNILATRFLLPLAGAGAALTAIGVKSADTRILGQFGLTSAGVSRKTAADQMTSIQQYAIDTPYSLEVMHEYQMRLIRAMAASDENWFSTDNQKRGKAADSAAVKTTDLIMAIGDSMARSGNLNPAEFQRAMYAIDKIMDRDRAPTRNISQLVNATGIPAAELANLLGFKSSEEFWKTVGTPAKDGGGVTGQEIVDSLLKNWRGEGHREGSRGAAEQMTSATISGRLQQLKEQATFQLGNLFAREDEETGRYEYTALGERLMGKKTPQFDKEGEITGYEYEGGFLQQLQSWGEEYGPKIPKFLDLFFDAIESFANTITKITDFLDQNPVIMDTIKAVGAFLIEWGPLILAVGLLSKVIGKMVGLFGRAMTPLAALTRGVVGAVQGGRNLADQGRAANAEENAVRRRLEADRDARRAANGRGTLRERIRENRDINRTSRQAGRQAYRDRRAQNRDGDRRGLARRGLDSFIGRDSNARDQQRALRDLDQRAQEAREEVARLLAELREVNQASLARIADAMSTGRTSVQGAAGQAQTAVTNVVTQGTTPLNNADLDAIRRQFTTLEGAVDKVKAAANDVVTKVQSLSNQQLDTVTSEFTQLRTAAEEAGKHITSANTRTGNLNGKDLNGVTGEFNSLKDAALRAAQEIGTGTMSASVSGRIENLKKRRLTDIIAEFNKLTDAADKGYDKIGMGTGGGSLAGRIGLLNGRSLKEITKKVDDLRKALAKADDEADGLDNALGRIGDRSGGGGGGTKDKGGKKNARGGVATQADVSRYGVMPGYAPWVDNIPAVLSPGEAVLRPEVTSHLGEGTINAWNSMAVRGQLSRHARGGVVGSSGSRFNLEDIQALVDLQNIYPVGTAMLKTMKMDGASDALGGTTQGGILSTGDGSARFGGGVAAEKFKGMYDWMTDDVFSVLQKVPTGVGQIAGILGGTMSPIIGEYFWNDVWKGSGNVVDRGQRFMGHLFSTETLGKVWDNLYSGVSDSAGAIWDTVTDPIGTFSDAFSDIGSILSGSYNNLIGMTDTVKEVKDSPLGYAGRVFNGFMSTAKDSMPNTKGLFDFEKGAKVKADIPDYEALLGKPGPGEGAGKWRLVATQAMQMLGLPLSALSTVLYRIQMESGGNPLAVNNWDINAKNGTPSVGLMQVIGPTFQRWAGMFRNTGPFMHGTSVNPLANIYAGLNYARNRYGARWQSVLAGNTGYADGTLSASPGLAMVGERGRELVAFGGGERVFNNDETESLLNGKKYEIHVHEARNEPTPQAVMRALQTAEALYSNL